MRTCWRNISAARNSFAVLNAACRLKGIDLEPVDTSTPDVTCYSLNSVNARKYEHEIRDARCITIAGGPHPSACYREVTEYADYVIVGEGEHTLPALLQYIRSGCQGDLPPGVATESTYTSLDCTVVPDAYPPFSDVKGYIEITRGCPFRCGYCQTPSLFGHCMRHRSIDTIAMHANSVRDARFVTPNALAYGSDGRFPRLDKVEALLKKIHSDIYFGTFPSEVRPEFISEESLGLLARYCRNTRLHFGAQSGSDKVLSLLHRNHSVSDAVRAVELCHDHDFIPVVDFILGLPCEDETDQEKSMELIQWITRYGIVHVHRFLPLPGTPLAATTPSPIAAGVQKVLGKLALNGKITGSWCDPQIRFFRTRSNDIP